MNYSLRGKNPSVYQSPYRLLIILVLSIFISEAFLMILLSLLPPLPLWFEVLFDSALLVVLLSPMLYFFLFHPLVMHIAERRRAEEALAESEERYRKLIEFSPEAIAVHSEGKIVFLNTAGARLLGATHPEQVIGKNIIGIVHPAYREIVRERVGQMREEGKVVPLIEEKFVRLDGTIIDVEVAAMPLTYQGKPAIQVVIRDITERKRIEERLRLFRSLIDKSNDAIFVDDPETGRILDANDKACSSLGCTREELLNMRVFDIEATIPDHFSWKDHVEEVQRKGYLIIEGQHRRKDGTALPVEVNVSYITIGENSYIVDGTKRMQRIIEDLLAYSRVGTRGKPFETTDLEAVFNQALDNLKVAIEENNATITHDPLPTVMADVTQMIQLFQNLAGNAIKFRKKEEPPRVHVSARRKENEWLFSVRDNGIGISPEFQSRLFNIFQREHTASEYPGTGIGLAICKKIVERHGGRIWAESVHGEGSTFYFTIPVKREESTARSSEALAG